MFCSFRVRIRVAKKVNIVRQRVNIVSQRVNIVSQRMNTVRENVKIVRQRVNIVRGKVYFITRGKVICLPVCHMFSIGKRIIWQLLPENLFRCANPARRTGPTVRNYHLLTDCSSMHRFLESVFLLLYMPVSIWVCLTDVKSYKNIYFFFRHIFSLVSWTFFFVGLVKFSVNSSFEFNAVFHKLRFSPVILTFFW